MALVRDFYILYYDMYLNRVKPANAVELRIVVRIGGDSKPEEIIGYTLHQPFTSKKLGVALQEIGLKLTEGDNEERFEIR